MAIPFECYGCILGSLPGLAERATDDAAERHRLVKESGIKFGLFTEDGNIWDFYPYWHSWISFTLEAGVVARTPKAYENLL